MDLRVEQLAWRAGVSVDTVRFYQSRGLLPTPRREGRVALYEASHLERIARIRDLQAKGFTLAAIGRLLAGELDEADEALVAAVAGAVARPATDDASSGDEEFLTIEQLAETSGIPLPLLQAVAREGMLVPRMHGGEPRFTSSDAAIARDGLRLLEQGLPLPEVLALARRHHEAMRSVAEEAVALFDTHIRQPLRASGVEGEAAAERLVAAFQALLPATTRLVSHHFQRVLLAVAQEHIDKVGDKAERDAVATESRRRMEVVR